MCIFNLNRYWQITSQKVPQYSQPFCQCRRVSFFFSSQPLSFSFGQVEKNGMSLVHPAAPVIACLCLCTSAFVLCLVSPPGCPFSFSLPGELLLGFQNPAQMTSTWEASLTLWSACFPPRCRCSSVVPSASPVTGYKQGLGLWKSSL